MSQSPPHIAVIGAGPAGCLLGRLLYLAGIQCTIFEAEESLDFRSQGGTLDLQSGLDALRAAGVYDEYMKYSRFAGSALGVCDKNATFYIKVGPSKYGNREIDRVDLRALLLRSLPDGMVRWKHRLVRMDEKLVLHFDQGIQKGFDLVIGADGAWSEVRKVLTEEIPFFSGVAGYFSSITDAAESSPSVSEFVNGGSIFSFSNGKALNAQQLGTGAIQVSSWAVRASPIDSESSTLANNELLEQHPDWAPQLVNMIRAASNDFRSRSLYMLPIDFKWNHKPGVTLIGDAAHLMTPFGGEGVNLAFQDSLKLANAIIDATNLGLESSLDSKILAFEKNMFYRAHAAQIMTDGMKNDMFFTAGAPRSTIGSWVLKKINYGLPRSIRPFVYPFVAAVTHMYFFFYKLFV